MWLWGGPRRLRSKCGCPRQQSEKELSADSGVERIKNVRGTGYMLAPRMAEEKD